MGILRVQNKKGMIMNEVKVPAEKNGESTF